MKPCIRPQGGRAKRLQTGGSAAALQAGAGGFKSDTTIPQVSGSEGSYCVPCEAHEEQEIVTHENGKGIYIKERNIFICPMGNVMPPMFYKNGDRTARHYNYRACSKCTNRCTKVKYRTFGVRMKRDEFSKDYNAENLFIKQIHIIPNPEIISLRKELAEHPFGTIKRAMDAGYVLTKRIKNVTGEFSLVFLAYNLKRVINIMGVKRLIEALYQRRYCLFWRNNPIYPLCA